MASSEHESELTSDTDGTVIDLREQAQTDRQLADNLERVSMPVAENVLRRAIDLHHAEEFDDSTMSLDDLERMGIELGITPATIQQAVRDELEAGNSGATAWLERLIVPKRLNAGLVVGSDAAAAADVLEEFLVEHEGVFEVERVGTSVTWRGQNIRGTAGAAMGPAWNSSHTLDRIGAVTTRLVDVGDGEQLLEVTVDTSAIIKQTLGGTAGFLTIGAVLGALLAGLGTNAPDFMPWITEFFLPFFGIGLAGFGGMVMEARSSMGAVRRSVNRVLHTVRSRLRRSPRQRLP